MEEILCPVYKRCGGCQLQNLTYPEQLRYKQCRVIRLVGKYCHVREIIGMDNPTHYRCKVQAAFGQGVHGVISGVYQSSSHRIVPVDSCLTENETADRIIVTVRNLMGKLKIRPYNEEDRRGCVRHVLVRVGCFTGEVMVVLVTGSYEFPSKKTFLQELLKRCPEITTVVQSVNNRFTSLVLGDKFETMYGKGFIEDTLCGFRFRISPASFYQINPVMTEKLYSAAISALELKGTEVVIDAYCGTGTIGLIASGSAKSVLGIEKNNDAVKDAVRNAAANKIDNIRFIRADAGEYLEVMASRGEHADAVIMDPPRAGSTVTFMNSVIKLGPKNVVYVSCDPETLARDLGYFTTHGYSAVYCQPFDMFPFTGHCETVVLLGKENNQLTEDNYFEVLSSKVYDGVCIPVTLDCENIAVKNRQTISYKELQDYILKTSNIKVSTLEIAQVKSYCGLEKRKCYNTGKEEHFVPKCTWKKSVLIINALKHFEIVKEDFPLPEKPEKKTTYKDISEYIYKNYHRTVDNSFIAQMKEACGLEKGIANNRNEGKSPLHCPTELWKMIFEAFQHFEMVPADLPLPEEKKSERRNNRNKS